MICSNSIKEGNPNELITVIVRRIDHKKYSAEMKHLTSGISLTFDDNVLGLIAFRDFLDMIRGQFKPERLKVKIHETENMRNAIFFGIADCID